MCLFKHIEKNFILDLIEVLIYYLVYFLIFYDTFKIIYTEIRKPQVGYK